jgi:hypothetical protein
MDVEVFFVVEAEMKFKKKSNIKKTDKAKLKIPIERE